MSETIPIPLSSSGIILLSFRFISIALKLETPYSAFHHHILAAIFKKPSHDKIPQKYYQLCPNKVPVT